jgi:hypothetical protein
MSMGTTLRSRFDPEGDVQQRFVREANVMASRYLPKDIYTSAQPLAN